MKSAFLNGEIEEIYDIQSEGFMKKGKEETMLKFNDTD